MGEKIKIEFYSSKFEGRDGCEIDGCDQPLVGYLEFSGFNQCMYVCEDHKNSITEDNPLLISYLNLLNACC
jgi:hypothetical protein